MSHARSSAALIALLIVAGCNSESNTIPSPIPGGGDSTGVLSGTVVRHLDRTPVQGATLLSGPAGAVTAPDGQFTMSGMPSSGAAGVVVNASGHVYRRVVFSMTPNRAGVTIDVLRDAAPFDLQFYRMWVRDSFQGVSLQPTRPWTMNPNFYFKTALEDTEEIVPDDVIDRLVGIFTNSVSELSGGTRQIGTVERGTDARELEDGWVHIIFARNLGGTLGRSTVGGNSGTMSLVYAPALLPTPQNNPFDCEFYMYSVADHEITHTMGYWHTFDVINDTFSGPGCTGAGRPERTRLHSAIMYSRPPGNLDPDVDPVDALQSKAAIAGPKPVVECFRY